MNLKIWGASTLKAFTHSIALGFKSQGVTLDSSLAFDGGLAQIHASPEAVQEDMVILQEALNVDYPVIFLIHRPDELLENQALVRGLSQKNARFILLGDLVFDLPFWSLRKSQCSVIPHPFMDISLPPKRDKFVVGTFTSWGSMRRLEHYLKLVHELKNNSSFEFMIGGSGIDRWMIPSYVRLVDSPFIPHFNVQLYHLHGKKRMGESSGSLHRGVSVPVIFEANGAERLENLRVVKIEASLDLVHVDYQRAAKTIQEIGQSQFSEYLAHNFHQAKSNSPESFAKSVLTLY